MLGAIAGDIIGSVYEWNNIKRKDFPLFSEACFFTDDTILTVALADSILNKVPYRDNLKLFYQAYPNAGYGASFRRWASSSTSEPYNSWGNGAAMRISPVGYAYADLDTVLRKAHEFTVITHNHPEGVKGAQATAAAIFLARNGKSKAEIQNYITREFGYDLETTVDSIRPSYTFDVSCQGTVPPAIRAFLESTDFEDALRIAVSLGGDSDTLACITGSIAEAFYGVVPENISQQVYRRLDTRLSAITKQFIQHYITQAETTMSHQAAKIYIKHISLIKGEPTAGEIIHIDRLPTIDAGRLFKSDGTTEVLVGSKITAEEASQLQFFANEPPPVRYGSIQFRSSVHGERLFIF